MHNIKPFAILIFASSFMTCGGKDINVGRAGDESSIDAKSETKSITNPPSSVFAAELGLKAWASKIEAGTKVGTNQQGAKYQATANRASPDFALGSVNFEPTESLENTFVSTGVWGRARR